MPVVERYCPLSTCATSAMPGPLSLTRTTQQLRRALAFERELDLAAAGVAEGVARDLRNGGGDARLVLSVEAEQPGDLARALARHDHVLLVLERRLSGAALRHVRLPASLPDCG